MNEADSGLAVVSAVEFRSSPFLREPAGLLLCVLATAIVTLPIWFARFAPLHDFPFHVARMSILNDLVHGGPFTRFYEVNSFLVPNLGMDLIVLALEQVCSVETACRIFLILTIFLMISGKHFLHRTLFRTNGLAVPIAALLAYNSIFTLGFVNYLLGVGLVPWAAGAFVRLQSRAVAVQLAMGVLMSLLLMLTHLAAFGLFAIVVAGLELQAVLTTMRTSRAAGAARLAWSATPFVVVIGLFLLVSPTAGAPTDGPGLAPDGINLSSLVAILGQKLWILRRFLAGGEDMLLDYASIAMAVVIAVILFIVTNARIARPAVLAIILLCVAFMTAPSFLLSATYLDMRLPVAIVFVAAGCIHFAADSARARARLILFLLGLVLLRSAVLAKDWAGYDAVERQFTDAYACLPRGSVLFVARPPSHDIGLWSGFWQPPIKHIASLASVTDGVFVPQTYARAGQQPIRVRRDFENIYTFQTPNPIRVADTAELHRTIQDIRVLMQGRSASPEDGGDWQVYLMLLEPDLLGSPAIAEAPMIADQRLFSIYRLDAGGAKAAGSRCDTPASFEGSLQHVR
jgi:hypothetical protein